MSYQLSPTDQQILYASSVLTTYGGLLMFSLGMIGNTINIVVFCHLKAYRSLASSAFLAVASFSGQVFLCFSLLLSALSKLIGYSPMSRNLSFCRATQFIPRVAMQIALTCLCLSAIDRYLMTSRSARQRSWVTPRRARLAIVVCIVVWCAYGVPSAIYAINYPFINICVPGTQFGNTLTFLNLIFAVLMPITILCVFGVLTWKNLERARLSSMNVQVSKMILLDGLVILVSNVPMAAFLIYIVTTLNSRQFTAMETLLIYLAQLLSSIQSCGSFYFYLMVSSAFRKKVKEMLIRVITCGTVVRRTEIGPLSAIAPKGGSTLVEVAK